MEDELVRLTKQLISYPTVTGRKKDAEKALSFIEGYLDGLAQAEIERDGYSSLTISNVGLDGKPYDLILHGHIDVVPAAEQNEYTPYLRDGRLYGRGSLDMKGGLACLMVLMKHMMVKKDKRLLLLVTSDEEVGGTNGTEYLMKKMGYRGRFFITAEGEKEYFLKAEQKGAFMFRLVARGEGDHSAYTWKGVNAISMLYEAYQSVAEKFPHRNDPDHWYSTVNLGTIQGGLSRNSIPEMAMAELDVRYCGQGMDDKKVEEIIRSSLKAYPQVAYKVLYKTPQMKTSLDNPELKLLNQVSREVLGVQKDLYVKNHGTNDARFASEAGIPAVGFGPVGDNYHAKNEYVLVKSLVDYYRILESFVKKM